MAAANEIVLRDPALKANPYPLFERLRGELPVCRVRGVTRHFWLVTRYDDVAFVLKDPRFASNRSNAAPVKRGSIEKLIFSAYGPVFTNMLGSDEPDHGRLRALVQQAFTPRRVEALRARIEALTHEYLDGVKSKRQWDVVADYALPIPVTVIAEMMGVPAPERPRLRKFSDMLVRSFASSSRNMLWNAPRIIAFLRYLRALVRQRRKRPQDDLIGALILAEEAGDKLNEDELVSMILLLLVAGHETTANLIGNGALALLENPAQMEMLRANPALIRSAVEEFARYYSPVEYASTRWARCNVAVGGIDIMKGEGMIASLSSANRDESKFERAEWLDVSREPNRHLSFGHGMHHCLGIFLARLEAQAAFGALLERYPEFKLAVPRESLSWRQSFLLRGLRALPVRSG